jgi:hypothetical protein
VPTSGINHFCKLSHVEQHEEHETTSCNLKKAITIWTGRASQAGLAGQAGRAGLAGRAGQGAVGPEGRDEPEGPEAK